MPIPDLPVLGWVVLALAALLVGIAKTSIGGMGALAVAGFALFLPTRESTAAVLLVLLVGDVVAVSTYRRSVDWRMLRRLLPSVLPGIALGALLIGVVDDDAMALAIALTLAVAVVVQVVMRLRPAAAPRGEPHLSATIATGVAGGFTTMVANAAGPVMALYLLAARVDKLAFVGTNAWFFLLVNLAKVPFAAGLGLFPATTLTLTLFLIPAVLLGTWIGRLLVHRLSQAWFERLALLATAIAVVVLLVEALRT